MPLFKVNGKVVHFVHIPKTGGTSIENWFAEKYPSLFRNARLSGVPMVLQHMDASVYPEVVGAWPDFEFTVVRNPFDRLVSAYRWRHAKAAENHQYIPHFKLWLHIKTRAMRKDPQMDDNHYKPQSSFVRDYTHIYKFEAGFASIIASLCQNLDLQYDESFPHYYKSDKIPVELDQECVEIITDIYRKDFELFDYAKTPAQNEKSGIRIVENIALGKLLWQEVRRGLLRRTLQYGLARARFNR